MSDVKVLMTGFPGFLSARLVAELVEQGEVGELWLLVLPRMRTAAEAKLHGLEREVSGLKGRWRVVEGDITLPGLGMSPGDAQDVRAHVERMWHLAAIYDLAVEDRTAYRVNVTGTINVLDVCAQCERLERLVYVSTCYVSGDREGRVLERELDAGQGFKNHYEETKFWAEVEVQRRVAKLGLRAVILRPGIVVGDSSTGRTDKYDGPYYVFQLLRRLPHWMPMVNIGSGEALVNVVPVDFAVQAMAHIGGARESVGAVFHIADPAPMRARDVLALALKILGRKPALAAIPRGVADRILSNAAVEEGLGLPREALAYFDHGARYDVSNTQRSLAETSIRCPHLSTYLEVLLGYMEREPDKEFLDARRV
ncbi:MAG: SDR family oxidoreductase [Myxococcota bacterium]